MKIHIDIGGVSAPSPVLLLCGDIVDWEAGADDAFHASCTADELDQVNCEGCKNHPDRAIHELKFELLVGA